MIKKVIFLLPAVIMTLNLNAQFIFERNTVQRYRIIEDSLKSESLRLQKYKVTADYFPGAKPLQEYYPLTCRRTEDSFNPYCKLQYYYNDVDSLVHTIVMEWNLMNQITDLTKDQELITAQVDRKEEYIQKYNQVKGDLIKKFGEPTSQKEVTDHVDEVTGEATWELLDKRIKITLNFTPILKDLGKNKTGTFRIRIKTILKSRP